MAQSAALSTRKKAGTHGTPSGQMLLSAACGHAGKDFKEEGPVILATGGFGADFTEEHTWDRLGVACVAKGSGLVLGDDFL